MLVSFAKPAAVYPRTRFLSSSGRRVYVGPCGATEFTFEAGVPVGRFHGVNHNADTTPCCCDLMSGVPHFQAPMKPFQVRRMADCWRESFDRSTLLDVLAAEYHARFDEEYRKPYVHEPYPN